MYNKLFTKILDSSIWLESTPTRIVWVTFLAMMDQDGIVALSSVGNVANRARVTEEEASEAISCLQSPDLRNPDQENDGRRIERIPGTGWVVLNAARYRDVIKAENARELNRERVARHRELKKAVIDQKNCDCCGREFQEPYSKYVVLDHHHESGKTRAYVCQSCNKVVGQIENGVKCHDKEKAALALAYISRHALVITGNETVMQSETETETETEKNKRGSGDAAPPPKPIDPRKVHPAIVGVQKVTGKMPPKEIWDELISTIGEEVHEVELNLCWVKWRAKGFKATNFAWALEWYPNGGPPAGYNGASAPARDADCSKCGNERWIKGTLESWPCDTCRPKELAAWEKARNKR